MYNNIPPRLEKGALGDNVKNVGAEVMKIGNQMQEGGDKPRPKVQWQVGELVRVKDGPFTDFNGAVEEVNYEKSKVRVSVTIFGRATPVELDFAQVEKV